ncbi:MAG: Na+/H+ antiporter NhaA [Chloroflexota bacterium]|nr:Na+/H+ antiporter NhaA [Chloroflexota bacterium]MDE2941570.1 Na+/H+ antiporter NhaA [Chloroflexota bacterium]MDE3268051.1 Na+/H+ antiporter NhaA [Chloroflexota bacterium]
MSTPHIVRALQLPLQKFIHTEETGAIVLLLAAAAALGLANSPWSDQYVDFWHTKLSMDIHIFALTEDLGHLVNDGLMAVFFFVVGLEIKRELVHGELSTFRRAALPVAAAIGGMAIPALIYLSFNPSGDGAAGWGIPMATDIAFALGVLALLGSRLPSELRVFLLGLAVFDDLGAIAVIAVFYADAISWLDLGLGVSTFAVMALCVRLGFRNQVLYIVLSYVMWQFFLQSGVHATLAGVLAAALVPSGPGVDRVKYADSVELLLREFRIAVAEGRLDEAEAITEEIETLSRRTEGPIERLEGTIHPWVSFLVLPVFALANAGIVFTSETLSAAASSSVTLGIAAGLLAGKVVGILGFTWLAVRLGVSALPSAVSWRHVLGVAALCGMGFTVSLFVSAIAFDHASLVDEAKIGVFGASLVAGAAGYAILRFASAKAPTSSG